MRLLLLLCLCASCGPPQKVKKEGRVDNGPYIVDEKHVARIILPDGHHYFFVTFGLSQFAYGGMDHCHDCPKCKLGGVE